MNLKHYLASVFLLSLSACETPGGKVPEWHGDIFDGDSSRGGIVHIDQNGKEEFISCTDKEFDEYKAVSKPDFSNIFTEVIFKCEKWPK